ncbi:MAG UNVERIFIED_CONTAM: hypothetical protein LVR18_03685 [Planctomycetaceae bacterium]|jgi:hypothetical protein
MLLSHMLVTIGDKEELPRLEAIEALYEKLSDRHCEEGKMQARHCEKHSDEAIHFYDYGSRRFARDDESGARDEGAPSSPTTKLLEPTHSIHTLNGCVIEKNAKNSYILIYRELGRNSYAPIKLENKAIWDERFLVKTTKHYTDLYVSYLNQDMYSQIKGKINLCGIIKENKKLLFILPIITNLEKVIAIPHINYYDDSEGDSYREIKLEFLRK